MSEAIAGMGDSVTLGVRTGVTEAQTFLARMALRFNRPYINAGVAGNTSTQMLARINADVIAHAPKYCTLMSGINDYYYSVSAADYRYNLTAMIGLLRNSGIIPVLMTPNLVRDSAFQAGMAPLVQVCREVGTATGLKTVEVYGMFCEGSVYPGGSTFVGWYPSTDELQHPGSIGHQKIDEMFALPQYAGLIKLFVQIPIGGEMKVVFNGSNASIVSNPSGITVTRLAAGHYKLEHADITVGSPVVGSVTASFGSCRVLNPITGSRQAGSIEIATTTNTGDALDHDYTTVQIN